MRSYLRIFKRSDKVSIEFWNEKSSLKRFTYTILKLSSVMWLTVREKLDLIPKLFIDPMRKVVVFEQIDFLAMLVLRKLVIKDLKIFFNRWILYLKVIFYALYVRLVLSQSAEHLLCLNACSFYAKRIFNGILFEKV